jgi:hypothetical protein
VKVARPVRRAAWGNGPGAIRAPRPRPTQPRQTLGRRRTHRLLNLALLCGFHHTWVHQRDLTATVTATDVTWHI